jgi:hypothetical protein
LNKGQIMDHSNTLSIYRARLCRTALVVGIAGSALFAASTGSASATAKAAGPAASDEQRPAFCAEADPSQLPHTADAIAGWFGRCHEAPSRGPNTADAIEAWSQAQVSADTNTTVTIAVPCFVRPLTWNLASNGPLPECNIQVASDEGTALARPRPSECPAPPDPDYVGVPWAAYTNECPDWWKQGQVL